MIKYVELTAPEASAYRQAKILSFECNEGDYVKAGDTLFMVQSGNTKLELPSTKDGRVVEFIVSEQENITLSTALLLLETEVESSTATPPLQQELESAAQNHATSPNNKTGAVHHEQQSLDLLAGLNSISSETEVASPSSTPEKSPSAEINENNSMPETTLLTISVPDIGADSAKVIEILVNVGDQVTVEDALVTLESDKASMDVPCTHSGIIRSISVAIDQDVSEGNAILELEAVTQDTTAGTIHSDAAKSPKENAAIADSQHSINTDSKDDVKTSVSVSIPDIGGDSAKVVEILVSLGDAVDIDDSLITLESDKASMDVPSTTAGTVKSIDVKVDDDVSQGTVVVTIEPSAAEYVVPPATQITQSATEVDSVSSSQSPSSAASTVTPQTAVQTLNASSAPAKNTAKDSNPSSSASHASPSIRRFARELGVELSKVNGTGRKNRVTQDDVKGFVKGALHAAAPASSSAATRPAGTGIPPIPTQDFSKFGDIELTPLNKIKRLTANNLHRSWLNVPHVTHNDESNINDLESFRKQLNAEYKAQNKGIKLSPLAFIVKAVVNALQLYPQFNSSLEPGGENLILKKYFHIGIAVETPNGLVVPVIRNADTKSVAQIAKEMGELASKARDKKLSMNDMSGACFTISSLGGIGGTSFTPIVNAPEVAILGVSRSKIQPVWNGEEFTPGMMLPLSLSYDHRVIDGAEAARFTRHIAAVLEDVRRLTV